MLAVVLQEQCELLLDVGRDYAAVAACTLCSHLIYPLIINYPFYTYFGLFKFANFVLIQFKN